MGPPRKGTGIGVLDPPGETPLPGLFRWPRISIWVAILVTLACLGALLAASLLLR